jgi:hypothetical protein
MEIFNVGDLAHDELTGRIVEILKIDVDANGNIGYFVSSKYLKGGRHPWELTAINAVKGLRQ